MKRNLLISLLMVGALIALNSCKKEYLVEVKGTVTGNVREYYTNQPLSGVLVSVMVNDQNILKDSTNASGYYSIVDVPSGSYWIVFSKAGYATVRGYITIESPDEVSNTTNGKKQSYAYGTISNAELAPTTGKINGVVTLSNGSSVPAGTTVVANIYEYGYNNVELEPALYSTTTDANGVYSFTNLPVNCKVICTAYTTTASGSSSGSNNSLTILHTVKPLQIPDFSISEETLYLVNYTGKGTGVKIDTTTTSIVLTFSENISEPITKSHGARNYLSKGGSEVLGAVTFSGNTVTITPTAGQLTSGATYTINYDVYASDTKAPATGTPSFTTKERAGTLSTPAITYDGTNGLRIVTISNPTWTKGAVRYDVYFKPKTADNSVDFTDLGLNISGISAPYVISDAAGTTAGSYYVVAHATGLDNIEAYSAPSNIATKD